MLGSITPLGERGRAQRWWATVTSFAVGAVAAGAAAGAALGAAGALLPGGRWQLATLAGLVAVGVAADLGLAGLRLPSWRRQVNEDWLRRYRGWVYGLGFGLQLGLGVATIVTVSATLAWMAAAFLAGGWEAGAAIGSVFGAARTAALGLARPVRTPAELGVLTARLERLDAPARRVAIAAEAATLVALVVLAG
jgi:hypothetical protein